VALYLKGITDLEDAKKVRQAGLAGIFVPNHDGRLNDHAISSYHALQKIVPLFKGCRQFDVFVDGGFREGADIVKALLFGVRRGLIL